MIDIVLPDDLRRIIIIKDIMGTRLPWGFRIQFDQGEELVTGLVSNGLVDTLWKFDMVFSRCI